MLSFSKYYPYLVMPQMRQWAGRGEAYTTPVQVCKQRKKKNILISCFVSKFVCLFSVAFFFLNFLFNVVIF